MSAIAPLYSAAACGDRGSGTLERPALKRLLADIAAGKVDVVVVYKIDRLSRSLMDFSRLVEVFDQHKVTFISVTQSFNTTTSMGRLTLNILLSTDYLAIAGLHKLAHARGIAVVVIHHVRMEADDPFDMVSGTNGLTGAADTILVLKRQAGNATLHARGRDIEEKETACRFDKMTCRWTLLGDADQVHSSGERAAIISALANGGSEGMHISEIMAATERNDRNAVDQLLFKMQRDRELVRIKRGLYALPGKIGKKERNEAYPSGK